MEFVINLDTISSIVSIIVLVSVLIGVSFIILRPVGETTLSRNQKRHAIVTINGKDVNVLRYLAKQAKKLPPLKHKRTGLYINHYQNLKKFYMIDGNIKDCDNYIKKVVRDSTRMAKKQGVKIIKTRL